MESRQRLIKDMKNGNEKLIRIAKILDKSRIKT